MKKYIILLFIVLSIFNINILSANEEKNSTKVTVVEYIPGANCEEKWDNTYECSITHWFDVVTEVMWNIIKIFTWIVVVAWVLFIVINWIMLSMWWMDSSVKEAVKWRITKTIIWLVLLLMSWVILSIIAPWVYK